VSGDLASAMKLMIESLRPDLRKYFRPSVRGKVTAVDAEAYRVDIVVGDDSTAEVPGLALPAVPVAALFAQDGYGVWALPEVDAEVTVSFHEGDPTQPYVESPLYYQNAAPAGFTPGTIALVGKHGQKLEFKPASNEIVISTSSLKMISTQKRQEAIVGQQSQRFVGDRTTLVEGAESVEADSWRVQATRSASVTAEAITETASGEIRQKAGGALRQQVGGSASRTVAGGATDAVAGNRREVVGGSYEMLVASTPGIAAPTPQPAWHIVVNLGDAAIDSVGGMINIGANPVLPPTAINVGSSVPAPVNLGGLGAVGQGAVYGPNLVTLLTGLLAALKTPLQIGNLGAPTAPNPAFITLVAAVEAQLATLLSTKVFISLL